MSNSKYLKYRVYSLSSQSEPQMGFKLMNDQGGWQSARSCSYPQQITIQFFFPMQTKSIRICFHQYKIPSLMEIFIKGVSKQKYRKLGYIKPSDNVQTNFQEKQIKTIYFQFPCSFIKFVLHRNYENQYNIFKQVGIDELSVQGQLLQPQLLKNYNCQQVESSEQETQEQKSTNRNEQKIVRKEQNKQNREEFKKIYVQLDKRKQIAIQNQDYQQASLIKSELTKFKEMENRMNELQRLKKIALQDEDYDKCAQLKYQTTLLKNSIDIQTAKLFNHNHSNQQRKLNINSNLNNNISEQLIYQTEQRNQQYLQIKNVTAIPIKYNHDYNSNIFNTAEKPNIVSNLVSPSNHQNQILPAILKKVNQSKLHPNTQKNLQQYPKQQSQKQIDSQLQQLESKLRSRLQHHFRYINQQVWQAIMMKNWKIKQKAFNSIKNMEINSPQKLLATFQLCSFSIIDKHPNIIIHTLVLLNNIITCNVSMPVYQHPPLFITQTLVSLIQLFNETNPKIRQLAIKTYQDFPDLSLLPISLPINLLIGKKNNKIKQNPKLVQTKISVMTKLIQRYEYTEQIYTEILQWAIGYLQDSNQQVRISATQLIIKGLLPFLGQDFIRNSVKNIRPNVLGNFNMIFNQSVANEKKSQLININNYNNSNNNYSRINQNKISSGNIINSNNLNYNSSGITNKSNMMLNDEYQLSQSEQNFSETRKITKNNSQIQMKVLQLEEQQSQDSLQYQRDQNRQYRPQYCDYCNHYDPKMIDSSAFSQHILSQCPALLNCQQCNQKIYIRDLRKHHIKECQATKYQRCNKCRIGFPMDQIYQHIAQNICLPRLKGFQRCQLCYAHIQPNDLAWIQHIPLCNKFI